MEDDADVWRYAILELHARNDDDVVVNESEMLRWVTRQWQRLNGKDGEISGVGAECCESFARMDVRRETILDSSSCRAKTSTTKDGTTSNREKIGRGRP